MITKPSTGCARRIPAYWRLQRWRGFTNSRGGDAFARGARMDTRDVVELVAANIGHDPGILPPRILAMMVLMALIAMFLTGPLLNLAECTKRR
jgi:hypothetical protein